MLVSKTMQLRQKILQFNHLLFYNDYLKASRVFLQDFRVCLSFIALKDKATHNYFWVKSNNITSRQRLLLKRKHLLTHTIQDKTVCRLALPRQTRSTHSRSDTPRPSTLQTAQAATVSELQRTSPP